MADLFDDTNILSSPSRAPSLAGLSRRPSGTGMQFGLRALTKRPSGPGLDFMAFARGAQIARDVNWQQRLRDQEKRRMHLQDVAFSKALEDSHERQEAARYLAPITRNRIQAARAGIDTPDFMEQQLQAVLDDPEFNNLDPGTQKRILGTMSQRAQVEAKRLADLGMGTRAVQLANAFNNPLPRSPLQAALLSGNTSRVMEALNSHFPGANLELNDDNTVTVAGQDVPLDALIQEVLASGNAGGVFNAAARAGRRSRQLGLAKLLHPELFPDTSGSGANTGMTTPLDKDLAILNQFGDVDVDQPGGAGGSFDDDGIPEPPPLPDPPVASDFPDNLTPQAREVQRQIDAIQNSNADLSGLPVRASDRLNALKAIQNALEENEDETGPALMALIRLLRQGPFQAAGQPIIQRILGNGIN